MNNSIVLLGYGRMGAMKKKIYDSLGYKVYIVDPHKNLNSTYQIDNIPNTYDSGKLCYDICTPTDIHIDILEEILEKQPTAQILVEKPLCNDIDSYKKFNDLIENNQECRVMLSENYLYSEALKKIKGIIEQKRLKIKKIQIEFSKDRREDIQNGRFIDKRLQGIGIEIPHIFGILYSLGFTDFKFDEVNYNQNTHDLSSTKFRDELFINATSNETNIDIFQSLTGRYKVLDENLATPQEHDIQSYRVLIIECENDYRISVQWDPIPRMPRYFSKIVLSNKKSIITEWDIYDNSLKNTILNFLSKEDEEDFYKKDKEFQYFQMNTLFELRNLCK
jgi:hypothetical protein